MHAPAPKLHWGEKAGYALGDTASNFYWKVFEVYVVFFYTDVFRLPPATLATMLLVTRVFDAVADPVMGIIADRTTTRWGKFRPYLLWCAIPLAACGVAAFSVPPATGGVGRVAYAYATYTLLMLAYTAVNIPYSALLGVMTPVSQERTSLSAYRFAGAFVGGVLVQKFTPDLVRHLGRGQAALGWSLALAVYGVAATALFVATFLLTRERVQPAVQQTADLRLEAADLVRSRPFRVLFGISVLIVASGFMRGSASAYYLTYSVGRRDLLGWFLASASLAALAGVGLTGPLSRRLGKRGLYGAVLMAGGTATAAYYWVPPERVDLVFAANAAIAFVLGPSAPLLWAMYADAVDYSEWRNRRRATALAFAGALFALKMGGAAGGWSLGVVLQSCGYVPHVSQAPAALLGIRLVMSAVPGAMLVAAAALLVFYEIDENLVRRIERELQARR